MVLVAIFVFCALVASFVYAFWLIDKFRQSHKERERGERETVDDGAELSYVHAPVAKSKPPVYSKAHRKAGAAEDYITSLLSRLGRHYIIFTNVIFTKPGIVKTTEIDHLVISPYGIFCIETKSHSGSIYGGARSSEWKQYLAGQAYPFYNPLMQNYNHTKALRQLLENRQKSKTHNYVVFPYASAVKVNSNAVFSSGYDLLEAISRHKVLIYNLAELTEIAHLIAKCTRSYGDMVDIHTDNVKRYVNRKN